MAAKRMTAAAIAKADADTIAAARIDARAEREELRSYQLALKARADELKVTASVQAKLDSLSDAERKAAQDIGLLPGETNLLGDSSLGG